jgi:hypothetical protein
MADVSYGSLPFAEQIAFFRRKLNLPTNAWTDIWLAEHDYAFVVAGANRDDLVADFRAAIDKAISQGTTLAQFRKDFDAIVAKYGWSYNGGRNWRSRVIYETNLRTSYAAGRYAQLQAIKDWRPYWQYIHSDAVRFPRPLHLAWNGLILAADDPWWQTHFPPNGWGCQCSIRSLAARDMTRLGKDGPDQAPPLDMQTVDVGARGPSPRTIETPAGVDPGFGYTPGRDAYARLVQSALQSTARLPAAAAASSAADLLDLSSAAQALLDGYRAWRAAGLADSGGFVVGALQPTVVAALAARGIEPATAAIVASVGIDAALTTEEIANLPALLAGAQAVLLDPAAQTLIYVFPRGSGMAALVVDVRLAAAGAVEANVYRNATPIDAPAVRDQLRAGTLVLLTGTF